MCGGCQRRRAGTSGDFEGEAGYSDHRYPYAVYGWTGVKPYG